MTGPKILAVDIETAPHRVYAWGLFGQNIAINQIEEPGYTLCWAAKWLGKKPVLFSSIHDDGSSKMVKKVWELINEADVVLHYNGAKFDMPTLNQEFVAAGLPPPAPYQQIDLYQVVKRQFRMASNKLDFVARQLGFAGKVEHKGMELWRGCMAGEPASWRIMERYNKRDVALLELVYTELQPWIPNHPNHALYSEGGQPTCSNCGGHRLARQGFAYTKTLRYQRYRCRDCGTWTRARTHDTPAKIRVGTLNQL